MFEKSQSLTSLPYDSPLKRQRISLHKRKEEAMKVIYKYPLAVTDMQTINLPEQAQILSIECQGAFLKMWALVDTNKPPEGRTFRIFGTGRALNGFEGTHIATFQQGALVWHVFEQPPPAQPKGLR